MCIWEDPEKHQISTMNQANQNEWLKKTQKKYHRIIQTTMRTELSNTPSEPVVCLSTCAVLFFLLINTWLASLISIFVEILFCRAEEPGPLSLITGLVNRIWCFYRHNPVHLWQGTQALLQAIAGQGHWRSLEGETWHTIQGDTWAESPESRLGMPRRGRDL